MYIRLIALLLLISGCAPNIMLGQINHWKLKAFVDTDEAKRYCAKKDKTPSLVFKNGWTYKFECLDK
jgi:hypothetical protein